MLSAMLVMACSAAEDAFLYNEWSSAGFEGRTVCAVTVRRSESGMVWFQCGDLKIRPSGYRFERQMRALCELIVSPLQYPDDEYYPAELLWLEPIDEGTFTDDAGVSGDDGLDILINSWISSCEDAYLTIHYNTWWGARPGHHDFYLVAGTDPDDPYVLELRHDSHSDGREQLSDGIVCFDINALPDTGGEIKTLSLKWKKLDGSTGVAKFGFRTRK